MPSNAPLPNMPPLTPPGRFSERSRLSSISSVFANAAQRLNPDAPAAAPGLDTPGGLRVVWLEEGETPAQAVQRLGWSAAEVTRWTLLYVQYAPASAQRNP
jgi:hypothetical protein